MLKYRLSCIMGMWVPSLLQLTRCTSVREPIVVVSVARNSHISSHLFPLGQVKVLHRINVVKT
jgi:hypothetical protein